MGEFFPLHSYRVSPKLIEVTIRHETKLLKNRTTKAILTAKAMKVLEIKKGASVDFFRTATLIRIVPFFFCIAEYLYFRVFVRLKFYRENKCENYLYETYIEMLFKQCLYLFNVLGIIFNYF